MTAWTRGSPEDLVKSQEQAQWMLEKTKAGHPTESHHVMARVSDFQELEKRFIPGSEDRIKGSYGFDDHRGGGRAGWSRPHPL